MLDENEQPGIERRSYLHRWALLLVCLAAFFLRFQGINWPAFHPDESVIGGWVNRTANGVSIKEKLYAGGFFKLVKPAVWISQGMDYCADVGAFRRGLKDRVHHTDYNAIMAARWFNVWAGTLVCLGGYLLVCRITRSAWAGVFGAALLGLAQYPVEHSHYAETDIAMLLCLTAALWLMAVAADNRKSSLFLLASLVAGFAAGAKFTLFMLLPVILALGLTFNPRPISLKTCCRTGSVVLVGSICFLLGFLIAMPQATDLDWFLKGLAHEKARVYGETALNLGLLRGDPHIRHCLHAKEFLAHLYTIGWGWLVLAVAGLPCLLAGVFRRFWTITLLFPVIFLAYWIYQAPWVRSQEFMAFLPTLTILAALPLSMLWRSGPGLQRWLVLILAVAALAVNGINGWRVSSLFGWTDTRILAKQWLQAQMPSPRAIATENYAEPAWADSGKPPVNIYKIEKNGLAILLEHNTDYLLRAASISGRGLRHPLTGCLYPSQQKLFDEFVLNSERLCVWAPLPPQGMATFVSPVMELYGLKSFANNGAGNATRLKIDLELPQPLWLNNYYEGEKGRQTFFPVGHKLGAATGILIDGLPRTIAIGGPEMPQGPVYLVFNTAERPATVVVRGFGQTRRKALSPYDAAIVSLERSPWRPRFNQFEEITLRTEPVKDMLFIPCFARVAFSLSEAARICLDLGMDETVWKTFDEQDVEARCNPDVAYLLAVRSERWKLAQQLDDAAARKATELEMLLRAVADSPGAVCINGNSGYYYNEFARIRLNAQPQATIDAREPDDAWSIIHEDTIMDCLELNDPIPAQPDRPPVYEGALTMPARLARGCYTFCGQLMARFEDATNDTENTPFVFYLSGSEQLLARVSAGKQGTWRACSFEFTVDREIQPRLRVRSQAPVRLFFRETEIRWTLASALAAVRDDLTAARAAYSIRNKDYPAALKALGELAPTAAGGESLIARQLALACQVGLNNTEAVRQAAGRVLDKAPGDYASLKIMAAADPTRKSIVAELAGNLKTPIEFGCGMRLVGFTWNPDGRKLACVWEAQRNETPPIALSLWIRRHGEWRKKQTSPLGDRPWLAKGERVIVEVKLNEAFAGCAPAAIALGLESAVKWHPGALPAMGRRESVVPFDELQRQY